MDLTSAGVRYSRERFSALEILGGGPGRRFFFVADFTIKEGWPQPEEFQKFSLAARFRCLSLGNIIIKVHSW